DRSHAFDVAADENKFGLCALSGAERERCAGQWEASNAQAVVILRPALIADVAQLDEVSPGRRRCEIEARIGTDCWIVVTVNQFLAGRVEQAHDRVERRAQ